MLQPPRPHQPCTPSRIVNLNTIKRTIIILAIRSDEERGTLERRTRGPDLLDLGYIRGEGRWVPVGFVSRGGVVVHAHRWGGRRRARRGG